MNAKKSWTTGSYIFLFYMKEAGFPRFHRTPYYCRVPLDDCFWVLIFQERFLGALSLVSNWQLFYQRGHWLAAGLLQGLSMWTVSGHEALKG